MAKFRLKLRQEVSINWHILTPSAIYFVIGKFILIFSFQKLILLLFSGGLFKLYFEKRARRAADYIAEVDAEFGPGHLQTSVLPATVRILCS